MLVFCRKYFGALKDKFAWAGVPFQITRSLFWSSSDLKGNNDQIKHCFIFLCSLLAHIFLSSCPSFGLFFSSIPRKCFEVSEMYTYIHIFMCNLAWHTWQAHLKNRNVSWHDMRLLRDFERTEAFLTSASSCLQFPISFFLPISCSEWTSPVVIELCKGVSFLTLEKKHLSFTKDS